jgi:hypothetical protein
MKTLEGHKAFPYIAWATLFLFSLFTFNLVLELKASVSELEKQTYSNLTAPQAKIKNTN